MHRYECGILKLVVEAGLNVYSFLTVRAVCKEGLSKLLLMGDDLRSRDERAGATTKERRKQRSVYRSDDFR